MKKAIVVASLVCLAALAGCGDGDRRAPSRPQSAQLQPAQKPQTQTAQPQKTAPAKSQEAAPAGKDTSRRSQRGSASRNEEVEVDMIDL